MHDLDEWIAERLPVTNGKAFFKECLTLEPNDYGWYDCWFAFALHDAAYGDCAGLSEFLVKDDYFNSLTPPKRRLLAWVLNHPPPKRPKQQPAHRSMMELVFLVAERETVFKYRRTEAVRDAVEEQLYRRRLAEADGRPEGVWHPQDDGHSPGELHAYKVDSKVKGLLAAIREGGPFHEIYIKRVKQLKQ